MCTRQGARLVPQELVQGATGKPLTAAASLRYLEAQVPGGGDDERPCVDLSNLSATKRKLGAQLRGLVGKAIEDYA